MRKLLLVVFGLMFLVGCGAPATPASADVSQEEYDKVIDERNALADELASLLLSGENTTAITSPPPTSISAPPEPTAPPVAVVADTEPDVADPAARTGAVKGEDINLRSGPGTDYDIVAKVSEPSEVVILGEESGWYRVEVDGEEGYLREDFVAVDGTAPSREPDSTPTPPVDRPTPEPTPKAVTPAPTQEVAAETTSQRNAVRKAEEYLDYMAFSKKGLIDQLEYEGFSNADAAYAVDHISVDWDRQAELKAADYMEYMSFSRSSLIDQLEYEGFTRSQAERGAAAVGF